LCYAICRNIEGKKHTVPDGWLFAESRRLFKQPDVTPADQIELKWEKPDEDGLVKFMCEEKGFSEERIRNGAKKLLKARQGSTQGRLDSFFKVLPNSPNATIAAKRKSEEISKDNKKAKTSGGGKKAFCRR
jgi:flap endonuclease-1